MIIVPDEFMVIAFHQGDASDLPRCSRAIVPRTLKNGGAVLIQDSDDIEHTLAVAAQIEDAAAKDG